MRLLRSPLLISLILAFCADSASSINPRATLDQLKRLEILCYVPAWLPENFKLKSVRLTYDEPGPDEGSVGRFPLYGLEYADGHGATFTVDSAREGIGDRNIMETDDSEEITITSPFGPMSLICTPKGKGSATPKKEIKANWAEDPLMKSEKAKDRNAHPIHGRYHGFSATGLTLAEFEKIIASLHPIRQ